MKSLFVHDPKDMSAGISGGVQICTVDFLNIVRAASDAVSLFEVSVSRRPLLRFRRRLRLGSYLFYDPYEARERLAKAFQDVQPTHLFLNRSELIRFAPLVRELAPQIPIIVMSHGNQSGDDLYEIAGNGGRRSTGIGKLMATFQLGLDIVTESWFRHNLIDVVCTMSEEERVLERWLGSKRTVILPRLINPDPIQWTPASGRVGFVGTLDHTPNRVALEKLCNELVLQGANRSLELRIVGRPAGVGEELSERYPFVQYLGSLCDADLRLEVATWCLFLNPVFWLSRGASMKLGQSLSWAIPALTTRAGARGYSLTQDQAFITGDSAEEFVHQLIELVTKCANLDIVREKLLHPTQVWPDSKSLGERLKRELE